MILDRNAILFITDIRIEKINIPEWDGDVYIRELSGAERDRYEALNFTARTEGRVANIRGLIAAIAICDENGRRIFTDADAEALSAKNTKALDRIYAAVTDISSLSASAIDDAEKN